MKILSKTLDGADADEIELNDAIFALEPRADILHTVVSWQLARRRAGTRRILTRAEVNRTGKKLYKQKGTGNARHGGASVSQFRGGAKTMGPVVRSHEYDLPKKVRALGRDGQPFELEADELLAVCVQHEMDHLLGKVFVDYLSVLKRSRIRTKLLKRQREQQRA